MAFYLTVFIGFLGGLLGGMGMGGGTVLIPLLTLVIGVEQHAAQLANLLCFLPMAAISLRVHAKNHLLKKEGLAKIIIPSAILSAAGAFSALWLPSALLRKLFGIFLLILAGMRLFSLVSLWQKPHQGL
jgi:hypothetical protein